MPRLFHIVLTTVLLLVMPLSPARADMKKAEEAFKSGDYEAAFEEYAKYSNQGNAEATVKLAEIYLKGLGRDKDFGLGTIYLMVAAEKGHKEAQYQIGLVHLNGLGTPRNASKAAEWFKKSAEQGHPGSQANLGMLYFSGEGVPKDYGQARDLIYQAANSGFVRAQLVLGSLYMTEDRGVVKNYDNAKRWFYEAASQGNVVGQRELGKLYASGRVFDVTRGVFSYMWLEIARRNGDTMSGQFVEMLDSKVPPEKIAEAKKMADEWFEVTKKDENGKSEFVYHPPSEGLVDMSKFAPKMRTYETPGALAPTRNVGCVDVTSLTSDEIAPNIYLGVEDCVNREDYAKAFPLILMGRSFGRYDAKRIDGRADEGGIILEINTFAQVPRDKKAAMNTYFKAHNMAEDPEMKSFCKKIRKIGHPTYYPDYLIKHILAGVHQLEGDGLKRKFKAKKAWKEVVTKICEGPKVAAK